MNKRFQYLNTLLWIVILMIPFLLQTAGIIDTNQYKITKDNGWTSIFTGPFLHASYSHVMGNATSILLGTSLISVFYKRMYFPVVILGFLVPSVTMYLLGMKAVGISGLCYCLIWFIILRGLMSKNKWRFPLSCIILIFYGSSLHTIYPPSNPFSLVAWEAHLSGLLTGLVLAIYSKIRE